MNSKKTDLKGYHKTQTVLFFVVIAFALGCFSGVLLTIIKTESPVSSSAIDNHGNEVQKMLEALTKEASENPKDHVVWAQLGNIYFDSDQYDKAIGAYEKSLALVPDNPGVLTDLGIMYRRNGNPEKSIACFDRAIKADPEHEMARLNKGIVFMHDLKERDLALKVWEDLVDINPLAMASKEQSVDELIRHYKEHEKE